MSNQTLFELRLGPVALIIAAGLRSRHIDSEPAAAGPPSRPALKCLQSARAILKALSVASMYDPAIDSASAGIADLALRLIDSSLDELSPSQRCRAADERQPPGAGS
jgi:hypothetical protein